MRSRFLFIGILLIIAIACQSEKNKPIGFSSVEGLIARVLPSPNVAIDTIAEDTKLSEFVYGDDSVWLQNFFVPMFPEYKKTENGELEAIIDTPTIKYCNKNWLLPMEWKTDRLAIDYLFHIKTKNRNYLVLVLHDPNIEDVATRHSHIGWVDIDKSDDFCYIDGYLTSAANFVDYDNDGVLEFLLMKSTGMVIKQKEFKEFFSINICHPTPNIRTPEFIQKKNGEPLGFNFYDSAGMYYLTSGLNTGTKN